jgi:hypothetical protein
MLKITVISISLDGDGDPGNFRKEEEGFRSQED